jgi:FKBP-type peptidyl-prolyl cis-trans isomerase FklB
MFSLRSLFLFFTFAVASVVAGTGAEGLAFLAKKATEEGVVKLPSGLMYKELVAGVGKTPTADSPCACHYAGTLIDGTEFDSSYKRGAPTTFAPNQVIKGWTEAMQLMKEGGKWELYIPSELAYGDRGAGK